MRKIQERERVEVAQDSEQQDWKKEYDYALRRIKDWTGLELSNLEKRDVREKVKYALEIARKTEDKWNRFSAGNEAAVWFIKDNYGVDINDPEVRYILREIDLDYAEKGARHLVSREWFKRKQDEMHKP